MKVLVSDLDGTLIHQGQIISQKDLEMMKTLQKQGHLVVICTGRSFKEFVSAQEIYHFPFDYVILNNGGLIIDKNYKTLFEKVIEKEVGIHILNHIASYPELCSMFCDGEETYGLINGQCVNYGENNQKVDTPYQDLYQRAQHFYILAFHQQNEETSITKKCYEEIVEKYGQHVEAYFNTHFVDVVPQGCSKGNGMKSLLKILNQPIDQVYAIGDSHNDMTMLKEADFGYTFTHANKEMKEITNYHVDYVHQMIEKMLED